MVRLEIIDILAENEGPEVLAQELDHVERVIEPWPVSREAITLVVSLQAHLCSA